MFDEYEDLENWKASYFSFFGKDRKISVMKKYLSGGFHGRIH